MESLPQDYGLSYSSGLFLLIGGRNERRRLRYLLMGEIVEFGKKEPHLSGMAVCKGCGHEWFAVEPVGTVEFECPECGLEKGVYQGFVYPSDDVWTCNCGNDLFFNMRGYFMCCRCGEEQVFQ